MSGAAGAPAGARTDSRIDMGDPSAGPSQQEVINASGGMFEDHGQDEIELT